MIRTIRLLKLKGLSDEQIAQETGAPIELVMEVK